MNIWTEGTAMNKKCECCGSVRDCEPCCQCKQNTCLDCDTGGDWYCRCIICEKSENSLCDWQEKRLEMVYSPGGHKYEQAKEKLNKLSK
jgi:hypothetical protein